MFRHGGTSESDVGAPRISFNAFTTHRRRDRTYHGQKPHAWLPIAWGIQTGAQRVCGSTTGQWGAGHPTLTLSLRWCRATAYPPAGVPRFTTMRLSPRPFGSRFGVHLAVLCPELRPPSVAIHSVRDTAHSFPAHGSSVVHPLSWAPLRACDLHVGASPSRVIHTSLDGVLTASAALLIPITYLSPSPRRRIRWLSQRRWLLGESHPVAHPVDTCSSAQLSSACVPPPCLTLGG